MTEQQEAERGNLITQAEAAERRMTEREPPAPAGNPDDGPLMAVIQKVASDPNFDVEKLRELRAIQKEFQDEQNRKAYIDALARAQETMPIVAKNAHVFFEGRGGKADTDYWHVDYGELVKTIKPHLSREGLSYDHDVRQEDGRVYVTCTLSHVAGHEKTVTLSAPPDDTGGKNPIQQVKSTVRYLMRATLELVSGAAPEGDDDDGRGFDAEAVELITEEQVAEIEAALEELGASDEDRATFLSFLSKRAKREIETFADIPSSVLLQARHTLANMRKQRAAAPSPKAVADAVRRQDEMLEV